MNWYSTTGRKPWAPSPTASPAKRDSDSGVSSTRPSPKRASRPSVARKTPPSTPTSSPRTSTLSSSARARASARRTASTIATSAMLGLRDQEGALRGQVVGQLGMEVIEEAFRRLRRRRQIGLGRRLDLLAAGREQGFLL